MTDALRLLARPDKWYLGAGDGLIWAPPFPRWLETPGFWDEAHIFQYAIAPGFTVSFVVDGAPLPARCRRRSWSPAALTLEYDLGSLRARETRSAPGGALTTRWDVRNPGARPVTLDAIAWTAVDGEDLSAGGVTARRGALSFVRAVRDRQEHHAAVRSLLALTPSAQSFAGYRSQGNAAALPPRFEVTPFWDRYQRSGRLRRELHLGGIEPRGVVFLGVQRRFRIAGRGSASFEGALTLALEGGPPTSRRGAGDWRRFFAGVPQFHCSDPYLDHQWWYRWYGLRLHGIAPGAAPSYRHPTVCEGIHYFHTPISYSAQCHLRELRWLRDPAWGRGVLRTFLDHQRPDGSLPGRIPADHVEGPDFYHADWGGAVLALDAVHPEASFRREAYAGLARYADWLRRTRDRDESGMVDVVDQQETGQEYTSRYVAVDPTADRDEWANRIRLKGIDATVYAYRLFRALAYLAAEIEPAAADRWHTAADRTRQAVRGVMWDPELEMFSDVDPRLGRRTGVKAAVCFYPYATDLVDHQHLAGLRRHLFNRREFWTAFPVPSASMDDPNFNPDAEWKGKRHLCPWNGRVWPMTNSHVVDALAQVVRAHRPEWAPRLGDLLRRLVRMMSDEGRPDRPNAFEHYHPGTGRPSRYRGIDDYQHSWLIDLIVSHVLGVLPHGATGLTVHPLALGIAAARVAGLPVAGHRVAIAIAGPGYRVHVDGLRAGSGRVGEPLTVDF
ncbi:MAG TPA: trehalase family glycosidase [Gemmatimonadales bacterium]|nr:trehalase family glycosidase [Gemmatimonadales bacterium]